MKSKCFFGAGVFASLFFAGWLTKACAADSNAPTNQTVVVEMWGPTTVIFITDSNSPEPNYQGKSISQWFQSETEIKTNQLSLKELLTLKQVSTADEWGTVRFELPINYDAVKTNEWSLDLGGFNKDGDFVECCFADYERATNGHCLLWWNINYDPPGKHNYRARLVCAGPKLHWDEITVIGPALPFYSSNVCRFFEGSTLFDSTGAILQAKLKEQNATYSIELKTVKGKHIKTITGSTTNGMIDLDWDLTGEHGNKCKDGSFDAIFYVTYPGDTHTNAPARTTFNRIGG